MSCDCGRSSRRIVDRRLLIVADPEQQIVNLFLKCRKTFTAPKSRQIGLLDCLRLKIRSLHPPERVAHVGTPQGALGQELFEKSFGGKAKDERPAASALKSVDFGARHARALLAAAHNAIHVLDCHRQIVSLRPSTTVY